MSYENYQKFLYALLNAGEELPQLHSPEIPFSTFHAGKGSRAQPDSQ
ncbi:hypothetical protein T01_2997 [Trichinella spiralis]|uniref:Uncharacterized protein n=1 Tax=Trichinella spiralis TaxID=6334 RepID=A0A0V0YPF5_TRISP|nr:hypothetical protein T01_2997 [Trichinella spiralis]